MLRLQTAQRTVFGEKLLDLANFAAAALVFGQFVGQPPASWKVIAMDVTVWSALVAFALWLTGER